MTRKYKFMLLCLSFLLFACQGEDPEEVPSQDGIMETRASSEFMLNDSETIAERHERLDIDCLTSLDTPMYDQLRDEVRQLIPYERYDLRLLTWNSQVDNRPHYFDMAIFWVKQHSETLEWLLIGMYRLPKSNDTAWRLDETTHGVWRAFEEFPNPPTVNDLNSVSLDTLIARWGDFTAGLGFRFIKANLCEQTWRETIGGTPPRYLGLNRP